ncbi:MAG: AzlD domain-containing protein [Rhodocyclaceae bacterium]|jgi:branched-subunit amino acid transport protein|nr:AzlD domain-containing protein [Rhodocyclaceae bacterium]
MAEIAIWGVIAGLGLATFATRLSFLALLGEAELPRWLKQILHYVPPAILAAIVAPQLLAGAPGLAATLDGPRTAAALAGLAVAWASRSTFATIAAGMAVLWALTLVQW